MTTTTNHRPRQARVDRVRARLAVPASDLRRVVDPDSLGFASTEEITPLAGTVGQPRALAAIEYGLETRTPGFNIFVAGAPGSGRLTTVLDSIDAGVGARPSPRDWVYVHDFAAPDRPRAISLPAGRGTEFARAMDEFVAAAGREIPKAFESEEYGRRQREIAAEAAHRREALEHELEGFAKERGYLLRVTPTGLASVPLVDDEPVTREQFERLPEDRRAKIERAGEEVAERADAFVRRLHALEKETVERIQRLEGEVALYATGPLFHELEERFRDEPAVLEHVAAVRAQLPERLSDFREPSEPLPVLLGLANGRRDPHSSFRVNVLVDNAGSERAPVVVERNPTYYNLAGRIEYHGAFGSMLTDFREIKAGALHRANGGFLVLDVLDLFGHPFSWAALKRALRAREVQIENLGEEFSAVPSASLRPEPIPLDVKVVLIGPQPAYHLLYDADPDFRELFKVKAEFSPELDWSADHERNYAAFVSRWVRVNGLRHFDSGAVARLIEHGARLRESQSKLSARLIEISDLVSEASFWASKLGHRLVDAPDVELAIATREYRSNLLEERVRELIDDGTIAVDVAGERVGEVNGLSILDLGDHAFGKPTRLSARVALGRGGVESIERETELSGPIHSKGVLILSGYLAATYAQQLPLAVRATLTFEQSYDEVEGDSASSTELYALLSALAETPIDQGVAVTGSVDQRGRIQAVGGVTHKIEGFYAVCREQGLTGRQGVLIPAANVRHLMLSPEVVEAVAAGRFHVWAAETVDEGIELLTGVPAGTRRRDGSFREGTVHARAAARLAAYAESVREYAEADPA